MNNLTGNFRFRKNILGHMVIQFEYMIFEDNNNPYEETFTLEWRDAKSNDIKYFDFKKGYLNDV